MHPSVLPGRSYVSVASERISRSLFHWRARDFSLTPLTGQTPTFTRATAGGAVIDRHGRLRTPVHSQPRFEMQDLDGDGVRETPVLVFESQRQNLVPDSENLGAASWTLTGDAARTSGQRDPFGGTAAYLLSDPNGNGDRLESTADLAYTADGEKVAFKFVRAGSSTQSEMSIFDATATAVRHSVRLTWSAAGVPTVASNVGAGTIYPVIALEDGWYLVAFTATGVVAANDNRLHIFPSTSGVTGTIYAFGLQTENGVVPTHYIRTSGGVATRNAETLTYQFDFGSGLTASTDDFTFYAKIARPPVADYTGAVAGVRGILLLSTTGNLIALYINQANRAVTMQLTATSSVTATRTAPAGAAIEICGQVVDLTTGGKVRVDVGTGFTALSAAASAIAALGNTTMRMGYTDAGEELNGGLGEFRIHRGQFTMQQMRELL